MPQSSVGEPVKRASILCLVAALLLCACMPRKDDGATATTAKPADMHTSQNSLDWAGVYEGVLPCADCPGIKTRLTLARDGRYELATQYLERQAAPTSVRGQFTWLPGGTTIALDAQGSGQRFLVGEGRLVSLNRDGSPVGPSSANRVLTLVPKP
jgi:uncharacterized lipoprotein NlpE involved in copper resistance